MRPQFSCSAHHAALLATPADGVGRVRPRRRSRRVALLGGGRRRPVRRPARCRQRTLHQCGIARGFPVDDPAPDGGVVAGVTAAPQAAPGSEESGEAVPDGDEGPASSASSAAPTSAGGYVVRPATRCRRSPRANGMTVDPLAAANGLDPGGPARRPDADLSGARLPATGPAPVGARAAEGSRAGAAADTGDRQPRRSARSRRTTACRRRWPRRSATRRAASTTTSSPGPARPA